MLSAHDICMQQGDLQMQQNSYHHSCCCHQHGTSSSSATPPHTAARPHVSTHVQHIKHAAYSPFYLLPICMVCCCLQDNPELDAVWRLLQYCWNQHYQGIWQALQGYQWSPQVRPGCGDSGGCARWQQLCWFHFERA
jgi:hypothetical protein